MSVKHSNKSTEWCTPPWIIEYAGHIMGSIDYDPASSALVNDALVNAAQYCDSTDDGLSTVWNGNVFLNPPSRCGPDLPVCGNVRTCSCRLTHKFFCYAFEQFYTGEITNLFYVGFSLEQLKYLSDVDLHPDHVRLCILRKRVQYLTADLTPGNAPPHSSFVMLLTENIRALTMFDEMFGQHGRIHGILG